MSVDKLLQKALSRHKQLQFDEAAVLYRKFLKNHPNHLDANYLLGTLYAQVDNVQEAEKFLLKAAEIQPASPMVNVNLGNVYKAQERYDLAVECYTRAIQHKPDLAQAHFGLGSVLQIMQEDEQKVNDCYFKALALGPNIPEVHQVVGKIYFKAGRSEALDHFETARRLNPELKGIYKDLGIAYLRYDRFEEAAASLDIACGKTPEDIAVQYFLSVSKGIEPDQKLKEMYVKEEFDGFASTFDEMLADKLQYKGPSQLVDLLKEHCGDSMKFAHAVDLGCGTGLSGIAFREYAGFLAGIDISDRMLEIAATRKCYDSLLQGNIVALLNNSSTLFDLFIAADVLVYIGGLDELFAAVKAKANSGAVMVFTAESCDGEGFVLKPSGRYAHSTRYVHSRAREHAFDVISEKKIQLRTEGPNWIMGDIFLLKLK